MISLSKNSYCSSEETEKVAYYRLYKAWTSLRAYSSNSILFARSELGQHSSQPRKPLCKTTIKGGKIQQIHRGVILKIVDGSAYYSTTPPP